MTPSAATATATLGRDGRRSDEGERHEIALIAGGIGELDPYDDERDVVGELDEALGGRVCDGPLLGPNHRRVGIHAAKSTIKRGGVASAADHETGIVTGVGVTTVSVRIGRPGRGHR